MWPALQAETEEREEKSQTDEEIKLEYLSRKLYSVIAATLPAGKSATPIASQVDRFQVVVLGSLSCTITLQAGVSQH